MPYTNKDVALAIIDFLQTAVQKKDVQEDYAESLDVAIDCIGDAFGVDKSKATKINGQSLVDIINAGGASSSSAASQTQDKAAASTVDDDTKAEADALKVEGNKAMAARNYAEAIAKYTQAIELDPSNVVYLLNRAAAFSSLGQHDQAIADAEKAIGLDPNFSKAYSRMGLAKYASGDAKGAMDAYKKGLEIEGSTPSDAMQKGFETAKKRVEADLEKSIDTSLTPASSGAGAGAGAGGLPDFSSMFGGGMPSLGDMMNNPQVMQAAQEMMSNPQAMQNLLSNPAVKQMASQFGLGGGANGGPDLSGLMNNPMLSSFLGGAGGAGGAGGSGSGLDAAAKKDEE